MSDNSLHDMCLYEMLGVQKTATNDDIRRSYKRLALVLHPDKNKAPDAVHRFQAMQRAYEVLKDEKKRAVYDEGGLDRLKKFEDGREFPGFKALFVMIVLAYATVAGVPRHVKCHASESTPRLLTFAAHWRTWLCVLVTLAAVCCVHISVRQVSVQAGCSLFAHGPFGTPTHIAVGNSSTLTVYGASGPCSEGEATSVIELFCRRLEGTIASSRARIRPKEVEEFVPPVKVFRRFSKRSARRPWYSKYDHQSSFTFDDLSLVPEVHDVCVALRSG